MTKPKWTSCEQQSSGRRYWFDTRSEAEQFRLERKAMGKSVTDVEPCDEDGWTVWVSMSMKSTPITRAIAAGIDTLAAGEYVR
jgi:hypothetical protein